MWVVYDVGGKLLPPNRLWPAGLAGHSPVLALPSSFLDAAGLPRAWRGWPDEAANALVAATGGAALGVLRGLLIAMAMAVGQQIYRAARAPTSRSRASGPRNSVHRSPNRHRMPPHHHVDQPVGQYKDTRSRLTRAEGDDVCGVTAETCAGHQGS